MRTALQSRGPSRRQALGLLAAAAVRPPDGAAAIIKRTLASPPSTLNTDWFGTLLIHGLLEWDELGVPGAAAFAKGWFEHHLASGRLAPYSGARSRGVTAGGIPITTYAGHYGLAIPCFQLASRFGDDRARRVCVEVADIILHRSARNRLGMVAHDDTSEFAIPDTCYFVVSALASAYALTRASAFRDDAAYQLRIYTDTFLDRGTGLARTILFKDGLGKSYWTRASGWLLWAMAAGLRHGCGEARDFGALAAGMRRALDASGALRLFLDRPDSPLETTGTAMYAMGVHEGVRRGWLPRDYAESAARAWTFVQRNITPEGKVVNAYTGWAVPAERGDVEIDRHEMGWIPGFILSAAAEFARG